MIYDETKTCLTTECLPYLFKPIPKKSKFSALRVLGYVRGYRVYAKIKVGDATHYVDVITGSLYFELIHRTQPCTLEDAQGWVAGAKAREKAIGAKVWASQGIPGVLE